MAKLPAGSNPEGIHYLIDLQGCKEELLSNKSLLATTMEEAAKHAGATIVETLLHQFNPHGLSGVVVIAESHLAIHTWPEHNYAAIDVFTCGNADIAHQIYLNIREAFQPKECHFTKVERKPPSQIKHAQSEESLKGPTHGV